MPRYEQLEEAKLTPEQRRIWDECKAGPRGSVPPPVHVWLKSPGLADHDHKLGAYVRFDTPHTPKQTEIAILSQRDTGPRSSSGRRMSGSGCRPA
jgi:4-carboxymuconolactone decarboxylase